MAKVFFDIDGVAIDNNYHFLGRWANDWHEKTEDGKTIYEAVNENPSLIPHFRPTEYCEVFREMRRLHFLTCQPKSWLEFTHRWMDKNIRGVDYEIECFKRGYEKIAALEDEQRLVEDHPYLPTYNKIILIDRPYNWVEKSAETANAYRRVHSPEELRQAIESVLNC